MKTVFILACFDVYKGNNAASARLKNYARALVLNEGVQVVFVHLRKPLKRFELEELDSNIFRFKEEKHDELGFGSFVNIFKYLKCLKKESVKYENPIFLFYPSVSDIIYVLSLLWIFNKKELYCEVNEVRRFAFDFSNWSLFAKVSAWLFDHLLCRFNGCIFISRKIQRYYSSKCSNSLVIPIISDLEQCTYDIQYKRNSTIKMVFTGTVSVEKENLKELILGFSLFLKSGNSAELHFYGHISKADFNVIDNILYKEKIRENVFFHDTVKQKDIAKVLRSADVLILPRRNTLQNNYGFSTKLSEYIVSGIPVILTKTGVVCDFFTDNINCIIVEGYDRYAFRDSFFKFLKKNDVELSAISTEALNTAKKYFDYKLYSRTLNNFLK